MNAQRWGLLGIAGLMAVPLAGPADAAGLFDDLAGALFGRRSAPVVEYYDPLSVTVRPAREHAQRWNTAPAQEVSSRPPPPVVKLDPATDSNWYLKDPTLRRGDIVVTSRGVKVYQGRDSDDLRTADFASLGTGKAGGKGWQQQLQSAAASGRSFFGTQTASTMTVGDVRP